MTITYHNLYNRGQLAIRILYNSSYFVLLDLYNVYWSECYSIKHRSLMYVYELVGHENKIVEYN